MRRPPRSARAPDRPTAPAERDAGMVTAETAVVLPVLVLVALLAVAVLGVAAAKVRVVDAAHVVALAAARGDAGAADLAGRVAPGSHATVGTEVDGLVVVTVECRTSLGPLPGPTVSARAVAPLEPDPARPAGPTGAP